MPVINRVVSTSEDLSCEPVDLLMTDGDETLFPHNSPDPYPDVIPFIKRIDAKQLILVSANPDRNVSEQRGATIGADVVVTPRIASWVKHGLFKYAIAAAFNATEEIDSALVLGNRWFMDVAVGRHVLYNSGVTNNRGIVIRRPEPTTTERFDQFFTSPAGMAGATVLRKLGYDHIIRPREDSRYI